MASPDQNSNVFNLIAQGTELKGEVKSSNDVRVDGSLEGNIDTKGKLVIGTTGKVFNAKVVGSNVDISGELIGNVTVSEVLTLRSTARVTGDITTLKLVVESGAVFNGTCKISSGGDSAFSREVKKPI